MRTRIAKIAVSISAAALFALSAPAKPDVESAGNGGLAGVERGGAATPAAGQTANKPPITPADYGRWESLGGGELSPDGGWLAVSIRRVDGAAELRLHELAATGGEPVVIENGARPVFSSDSRWLAYQIGYSEDEQERLREEDEPIRNKMGLRSLASGEAEVFEAVAGFEFDDGGSFLAIRGYTPEGAEAADLIVRSLASGSSINFGNIAEYAWQDDGTLLAMTVATRGGAGNGVQVYDAATGVLRVLDSGDATFRGATWREDADDLAVLRSVDDEAHEEPTHLLLAWRGLDAALAGGATAGPSRSLTPMPLRFDHRGAADFPADMRVVEHRAPQWSDDGMAIFFGVREWPEKPNTAEPEAEREGEEGEAAAGGDRGAARGEGRPAGAAGRVQGGAGQGEGGTTGQQEAAEDEEPEPADVDVWHARDERIIPMQKLQEERDRSRSYLSVWHVDEDRFVRLGTDLDESVALLAGEARATETDREPYIFDGMFGRRWFDVDLIDVATGERTGVVERVRNFSGGSADGRYLLYFKDDHHFAYEIATGEHRNLTAGLPSSFVDEEYDYPTEQKPPWGVAGWAKDDAAVLLYDRYDVWSIGPDGSGGAKITDGAAEQIEHRLIRLDREQDFIDPSRPIWFDLHGRWTKKYGYARLDPPAGGGAAGTPGADRRADGVSAGGRAAGPGHAPGGFSTAGPQRLLFVDKNAGGLARAENADVFAYTLQGFDDSPDYFAGGPDLAGARQVTRTNPFQADFAWGRSRLIDYDCEFGPRVQGALFYPAGYEAGGRYPMITYVYELRSATVHNYSVPSARSPYNPAVWTSLGYFVLEPDIVYRDRMPGTSAVECVRPAVKAAVETGMVDADRVGLVGHSWGGYEAAYIPTKTDIFAASVSGAALTNFFSMFGTIHWNQGMPESSHFETGQARMGVPYWEDMEAYVRESPVMGIPDLQTPMLMAFGDSDGTVDWHQGVEMYNYARRAGKQFVMLVYAGENHSNREEKNQLDYHRRILDWFGHYLKGEEAKPWILEGTSVIDRNDELRRQGGREGPNRR